LEKNVFEGRKSKIKKKRKLTPFPMDVNPEGIEGVPN